MIGGVPSFTKKGLIFELRGREGGKKDMHCSAQNIALFVDLL